MMRSNWKQWVLVSLGLLFAWEAWAQPACERYELLTPKRGSQISDRQPELHWNGDVNASYRLQVAVLLPEGRVLESVDTVVTGTKWRPGAPVSVVTAVYKVLVSRNCPTMSIQDLNAQGPYFIVQSTDQCALKPRSVGQKGKALEWTSLSNADKFVVQIFSVTQATDGTVLTRRVNSYEVAGASWTFPEELNTEIQWGTQTMSSWVASVQARCGALTSLPQAVKLNAVEFR